MIAALPDCIRSQDELDELLTRPQPELITFIRKLPGPLLILGAGGKMGPTLAVLAKRAAEAAGHPLEVLAASRFSDADARRWIETRGVGTLSLNLLDRDAVARLPDASQVVYLVGQKFGTAQNPAQTWAVNALIPAYIAERYQSVPIAALSTGNVYPLVAVPGPGSVETDGLTPLGEYANAGVARERIFEFFAHVHGTPLVLLRLNYAVELRYGVLLDIARKVHVGEPVDVTMGYFNCIWQGDANDMILRALGLARNPPLALNLTGSAVLSVRDLAMQFGELLGCTPHIIGQEADTALLSNVAKACALLGIPPTPVHQILRWTAEWVKQGGRTLNKPTHFETRDGKY
jgi:nucleoside-diphosphate-sugar epimerase